MTKPLKITLAITALAIALGVVAVAQNANRARVEFPQNFRQTMALYSTVDRADGKVYEIYINQAALQQWRTNRTLPDGTVFAIESFVAQRAANGQLQRDARGRLVKGESENEIHVSEKRTNWAQNGEQTSRGLLGGQQTQNGSWRVGAFDLRTGQPIAKTTAQIAECHTCHLERRAEDFVLSRGLLDGFARSNQPSYISFSCGAREICFGGP